MSNRLPYFSATFVLPEPFDGVGEIEIDAAAARADAAALVAHLLGRARGDVARGQVAEARIFALQVIIALALRESRLGWRLSPVLLRHPDAAVVAQRFGHQRQLRLMIAGDRDAGRMNLRVAGIGEGRPVLVGATGGRDVAADGVGGEVRRRCRSRRSPARRRRRRAIRSCR